MLIRQQPLDRLDAIKALGAERNEALSLQILERAVELVGDFGDDWQPEGEAQGATQISL